MLQTVQCSAGQRFAMDPESINILSHTMKAVSAHGVT